MSEAKISESEILFIGDSIIQGLQFTNLWREKISALHCINFGIGGDRTEHVLWRLLNGENDFNVKLKAVILFVGTNNINDSPENIFEGILECVKEIRNKHERANIIIPVRNCILQLFKYIIVFYLFRLYFQEVNFQIIFVKKIRK